MTEAFLQYLWQHRLFDGPLSTVDGQQVEVLRPGILNTDAGPDFSDVRLRIGDMLWAGNVEIHLRSSDWNRHHHSSDHAYDGVLLHVVAQHDAQITLPDGSPLLTLEVGNAIPDVVWQNYEALIDPPPSRPIGCADSIAALRPITLQSACDHLLVERLQRKTTQVAAILDQTHGDYEHCCYILVAHYFGGRVNAFPFELLAKSIDVRLIARWRDDQERLEALLFGQAGMLDHLFADDYPRRLQADYQALRSATRLTPLSSHLWKFFRIRPPGFPTLRISQFASLLAQPEPLFSQLLEQEHIDGLRQILTVSTSDYWTTHYHFDQPAKTHSGRVGDTFVDTLILNAWIPLLFEYGQRHDDDRRRQQAFDLISQFPPEDNSITRIWSSLGVAVDNAARSQALIQLYSQYCRSHQCLKCPLGYAVLTAHTAHTESTYTSYPSISDDVCLPVS